MRDVDNMPPRLSQTRTADCVLYTASHDETKSCNLLHDAARAGAVTASRRVAGIAVGDHARAGSASPEELKQATAALQDPATRKTHGTTH